jgi:LysR family transcriptional regulator (chromosome initiation inhibitor)
MSIDFRQLQALATVVDAGSFDKAGQRLSLTQSAISQRIQQLEKRLGKILLIRSSPPALTADGLSLMKYYRQMEHLQNELMTQYHLEPGTQRTVSIGVNADSLATWLLPALDQLINEEQLLLDIRIDDQDRTHEMLQNGEVLGCISASHSPISGCNCLPIGTMLYRCLVTPAYKARYFPNGINKEAMSKAPCVEFSHKDELQKNYLSTYFDIQSRPPTHRVPSTESYLDFVVRSHGWGMIPDLQSQSLRQQNKLIELVAGNHLTIPLYWHIWDLKSELSRRLTDALINQVELS